MNAVRKRATKANYRIAAEAKKLRLVKSSSELPKKTHPLVQAASSALNARVIAQELGKGKEKESGKGWMTICPCHDDSDPSLSVWDKDNGRFSWKCFAGCDYKMIGLELHKRKLIPQPLSTGKLLYDYLDEKGNAMMCVRRIEQDDGKKKFLQYHYGKDGRRKLGIRGYVDKPPVFNLPVVKKAIEEQITVFIVEGEKHAVALQAEGIPATTNVGGAGKWRDYNSDQLRGAKVVILPDNDVPGRDHAQKVAKSLAGKAKEIRILELPSLPPKGDVLDFLQDGKDHDKQIKRLKRLARQTPTYQPEVSDDKPAILEAMICSGTEFLNKKFPKPKVLLAPIIRTQSLTMVYAKAGVGKTFLIHSIVTALTRKNFEDLEIGPWAVQRQCGVLLIDGELPGGEIQDRLRGMMQSMGKESSTHPLQVITAEEVAVNHNQQLNLANSEWREAFTQHLNKHPEYKMVVIDNISSLVPGVNENAKQDWDPINQWLLSLRRTGKSVILVHHANKKGGDRGHSGRLDNLDNVLHLEDVGETDEVKFQVNFQKCRYLKPGEGRPFTLQLVEDEDGYSWEMDTVKESDNTLKDVIERLSQEGATQQKVADEISISQSRVSKLRKEAINLGYLDTKNRITEDGKEYLQQEE